MQWTIRQKQTNIEKDQWKAYDKSKYDTFVYIAILSGANTLYLLNLFLPQQKPHSHSHYNNYNERQKKNNIIFTNFNRKFLSK